MFIGMFLMTHHTFLMMSTCIACSAVLTELLVVVTTYVILYRLSCADPTMTVHIFDIMWVDTISAIAPISSAR